MKRSSLSLAIQAGILANAMVALPALAEEAQTEDALKDVEVIEVKGFRRSVQKSLNTKRFANTVVDAVSAEDVGKFPDQTVADALQRVPGVTVEKDMGESNRVSIRGTAPHLNTTLLNGQNVASATASASITRPSRGFNYSLLPAELVESLEVHKSAEADIDEGSVGGTVVVKTRKPLDMESGEAVFTVKGVYQENPDEYSPYLSGLYSWKNDNEDFGATVAYIHKDWNVQRDSQEVRLGYRRFDPDSPEVYPSSVGANRYESNDITDTGTLTFQWLPTDNLELVFTNLYSVVDSEASGTYSSAFVAGEVGGVTNPVYDDQGNLVAADMEDGRAYYGYAGYEGEYKTRVHDLDITYTGDNYVWHNQVGYTKADGEVTDNYSEYFADAATSFDLTGDAPQFTLDPNLSPDDYALDYNHLNDITNEADEVYLQTDFEYMLDHDFIRTVKVGAKYRDHNKESDMRKRSGYPKTATLGDFTTGGTESDFAVGSSQYLWEFDESAYEAWQAQNPPANDYQNLDYYYDLNEEILAFYLKTDFEYDRLRGNIGGRYVMTDTTTKGYTYEGRAWDPQNLELETYENDYDEFLPSLNLNYDLTNDVILRFAAAKVMARPDYDHMSPRNSRYCGWNGCFGYAGNPDIDPYEATQYDISAEWYFSSTSILSLAYFYKDIDSYVFQVSDYQTLPDDEGVDQEYLVTTVENGEGGVNQGIEITFHHELPLGFGVQANYTYSDADMDESAEQKAAGKEAILPNNSEHAYNLTGYYEADGLSARLAWNYRSEYYYGTYRDLDQYKDGYGQLDFNLGYNITDRVNLMFQALNLTDEEQESYFDGVDQPIGTFNYGRRYMAGVTVKL